MTSATGTTDTAELLAITGKALWRSACIGNAPPLIQRLYERMTHPVPGDLVIEISSFSRVFDPDSVGRLVRIEAPPGEAHTGGIVSAWVVEALHRPGEEQTWRDADFVALPDRRTWLDNA